MIEDHAYNIHKRLKFKHGHLDLHSFYAKDKELSISLCRPILGWHGRYNTTTMHMRLRHCLRLANVLMDLRKVRGHEGFKMEWKWCGLTDLITISHDGGVWSLSFSGSCQLRETIRLFAKEGKKLAAYLYFWAGMVGMGM